MLMPSSNHGTLRLHNDDDDDDDDGDDDYGDSHGGDYSGNV